LAFRAAGNNFEPAIAVCQTHFGAAFAAVSSPLIEMPMRVGLITVA